MVGQILLSLFLALSQWLAGWAGGTEAYDAKLAEAFLVELYTVDAQQLDELGEPSPKYTAYLEGRFGAYCEPEALDQLLSARFPFSLMEQAYDVQVDSVHIKTYDPAYPGAGIKLNYRGKASARIGEGPVQAVEFTGRLTLNPEDGRVQSVRVDHLSDHKIDGIRYTTPAPAIHSP